MFNKMDSNVSSGDVLSALGDVQVFSSHQASPNVVIISLNESLVNNRNSAIPRNL